MRMTKEQHESYLRDIMGKYDNPEDCADMISALRSDYDESINDTVSRSDYDSVIKERDDIKMKYIDRFFNGESKMAEIPKRQHDDIQKDTDENLTFEALFNFKEGYSGKDE